MGNQQTRIQSHSHRPPSLPERKNTRREERKMCHPSQTSPNPNQAWQGVYPDLSAFNDLFSPQAAPQPNPQTSPWISFLSFLGLQPAPATSTWFKPTRTPGKQHPVSTRWCSGMLPRLKQPKTIGSILQLLLQLSSHQAPVPSGHLSPPPLLHRCHQGLRHLLLRHRLLLHPLQPSWVPHPLRPLPGACHLSPGPPPASPPGRPCPLLSGDLPAPPLCPRPPPALPPQTPCAPPAPCQPGQLGSTIQWRQRCMDSLSPSGSPTPTVSAMRHSIPRKPF